MIVSTRGRYALRVMIDIAEHPNETYIPLKSIAARQGISEKYLEQIIAVLNKAGYVKSVRGAQGGYRIAKDPADYTVGMILRLTEGSLAPVACLENDAPPCERVGECRTLPLWQGLSKVIADYLDNITLQDILDNYKARSIDNYSI